MLEFIHLKIIQTVDMHGLECGSLDVPGYFSPAQASSCQCNVWMFVFCFEYFGKLKIDNGTKYAHITFSVILEF